MINLSRARLKPYDHQLTGVEALVRRPFFGLFDEMGIGKTKQVIDAAQVLFERDVIDRVIIIAPDAVRRVWFDKSTGELAKHLWRETPNRIIEFHAKIREWSWAEPHAAPPLQWIITNYDFIRSKNRLTQLLAFCTSKTLLVLDESSAVKNAMAIQSKHCMQIRKACGRVVLLTGTPIANHPGDMYSQGNIMSPRILDCYSYTQFCARYALMKPVMKRNGQPVKTPKGQIVKLPVAWSGIADIQEKFKPYVLMRQKKDCLDLPEKLPAIIMPVTMTPTTWASYVSMRDELLVWLGTSGVSMAPQAFTKLMRLAQITSGFIGGVVEMHLTDEDTTSDVAAVQEIGREKLDAFFEWLDLRLNDNENAKIFLLSCHRLELLRTSREMAEKYPHVATGLVIGGQPAKERDAAIKLLHPESAPTGPAVVLCSIGAGAMGLNMTASHTVYRMSRDYNLKNHLQAEDRVHRIGQTHVVSYTDSVAVGPKGQRTVDGGILAALLRKENLANYTTSAWRNILTPVDDEDLTRIYE